MPSPDSTQMNVRFRSVARVDADALKEVSDRAYRPYSIFAHAFSLACLCIGLFLQLFAGQTALFVGLCVAVVVIQIERVIVMRRNARMLVEREAEMERQLPDVFTPVRETVFTDEAIVSIKSGASIEYGDIAKVLQSEHYVILMQRSGIFVLVSKEDLEGGTVDELVSFVEERRKAG